MTESDKAQLMRAIGEGVLEVGYSLPAGGNRRPEADCELYVQTILASIKKAGFRIVRAPPG